jgi:hypothetical protein
MEETISQRIARERIERKLLSDAQEFAAKNTGKFKQSTVTSSRRKAELERTVTKVEPVTTPPPTPASGNTGKGKTIEFYVWKEGAMGKVKIMTEGDFEEI